MTTVLICDERRSARDGLNRVMASVPSVTGIDCVGGGDELLGRYGREAADVVLIGTQRALTSGIEATRRLLAIHPSAVVIVFGFCQLRLRLHQSRVALKHEIGSALARLGHLLRDLADAPARRHSYFTSVGLQSVGQ